MDVMKAIRKRRRIRGDDNRVEKEKLVQRLEPARNQSFVAVVPIVIAAYMVESKYVMSCGQA